MELALVIIISSALHMLGILQRTCLTVILPVPLLHSSVYTICSLFEQMAFLFAISCMESDHYYLFILKDIFEKKDVRL